MSKFLKLTLFFLFFSLSSIFAPIVGAQEEGGYRLRDYPQIGGPYVYLIDSQTLSISGSYEAGYNQYICPTDGPFDISYAYEVTYLEFVIEGTGISGYPFTYAQTPNGEDGLCGGFKEWVYDFTTTANVSSLTPGQTYTVRIHTTNSIGESMSQYGEFTMPSQPQVYGCMDSSASNYNSNATADDGSCQYVPNPGNFNINSWACYGWPNPAIEVNYSPSSNATYYTLQKWNGSGWADLYTGSYQQIDQYEDFNISMGNTYYYQVVAYNAAGNTVSNGYATQEATPANCGQVLHNLSVGINTGVGTITSSPSGISYPVDGSENYDQNTWVMLTATPSTGYSFSSWSGACAGQGSICSVYMNSAKSATVNFSTNTYALSVSKAGTGTGTVTSSPAGISCGAQCSNNFNYNTGVILTASAAADSTFAGWSGACSTSPCEVTMSAARNVTATFSTSNYTLTVTPPTGGTISGTGISCPGDCSEGYAYGTGVNLNANPSNNYAFSAWGGDCSGAGSCQLTMTVNKSVSASFALVPFNYSLSNSGTSNVTKASGNAFTQNTITKTLLAGTTQSVTLSLSGVPSGTTYAISNGTCSPTCTSTITFTVGPTTPAGIHSITVTGSPLSKTTNFNLVVTGSPFSVSCTASLATATLGQNVTFTGSAAGGRAPLTYTWSGTGIPTSPAPTTNPYTKSFSTIGQKSVALTVRDGDGVLSTCPAVTVQVNFDPDFEEF